MTDLDRPELPGSAMLAAQIERRRFLRRAAGGIFIGLTAAMAGEFHFVTHALANPKNPRHDCCGPGCPGLAFTFCGPSPCCNTSGCSVPCCAPGNLTCSGPCTENTSAWPNTDGCWANQSGNFIITCCDCNTGSSKCGGVCICSRVLHIAKIQAGVSA